MRYILIVNSHYQLSNGTTYVSKNQVLHPQSRQVQSAPQIADGFSGASLWLCTRLNTIAPCRLPIIFVSTVSTAAKWLSLGNGEGRRLFCRVFQNIFSNISLQIDYFRTQDWKLCKKSIPEDAARSVTTKKKKVSWSGYERLSGALLSESTSYHSSLQYRLCDIVFYSHYSCSRRYIGTHGLVICI